jgi:hypothetical protein
VNLATKAVEVDIVAEKARLAMDKAKGDHVKAEKAQAVLARAKGKRA